MSKRFAKNAGSSCFVSLGFVDEFICFTGPKNSRRGIKRLIFFFALGALLIFF